MTAEDLPSDATPSVVTKAEDEEAINPETEAAGSAILKNLVILPPLQKKGTLERDEIVDAVALPPIRAEEPVNSIRQALGEVCGYAHLTSYRFVLEPPPAKMSSSAQKNSTISPYTGRNAVVSVPEGVKSLEMEPQGIGNEKSLVLDDYGDLTSLVNNAGLQDDSAFRVVLERYDGALIRDHVIRLRSLLDGNAPNVTSLDDGTGAQTATSEEKQTETETPKADDAANKAEEKSDAEKKQEEDDVAEKEALEKVEEARKDMPKYSLDGPVAVNGNNLKDFFYLACGEDPALYSDEAAKADVNGTKTENVSKNKKSKKAKGKQQPREGDEEQKEEQTSEQSMLKIIPRLNELEEKTRVKCSIRLSGFHPPPQARRLVGDLAYYEVTPPGEDTTIHVTAIPTGFYVNQSSSKNGVYEFGPSPAAEPCFSHELLDCLLQCSSSLRSAWEEALEASKERAGLTAALNNDGPFASLFRVAIRGDLKGYNNPATASSADGIDAILQCPSWLAPIPRSKAKSEDSWNRNSVHTYNLARTEDELSNGFGIDIRSGALRDWNEELQGAREMPVATLQERIERAR
jgi:protein TIF31